jgi:16S rRNA processing protein RimM
MFIVGEIVGTHGIKGDVKVKRITDFAERFAIGEKVYCSVQEEERELIIDQFRTHKNIDILHFAGVHSMNEVKSLKGILLYIKEAQLTQLQEHEYYYHEIIGCEVYTTGGEKLGIIQEILSPGANDVWVVKNDKGKEILIPYIEDVVKEIHPVERFVQIELMEGLLE